MPAAPDTFRLGVNYWPSDTAMAWLARYDPCVVRRDFTRIAATGMDTVRVFLRWEDLQPAPTSVDAGALSGHPAAWAYDLGNENSNCTIPPDSAKVDPSARCCGATATMQPTCTTSPR